MRCKDESYYTGHTDNLKQRLQQHDGGTFGGYTALRKPLKLVFSCEFRSRLEALKAERQIKGWTRKKKEALIKGDWDLLKKLSKKNFT